MADSGEGFEFSPAVGAYSRAVEIQPLRTIFEPFKDQPDAGQLPSPINEKREGRSLSALEAFVNDQRKLTFGEMARGFSF